MCRQLYIAGLYPIEKYPDALRAFEAALKLDPQNRAAKEGAKSCAEKSPATAPAK